MLFFRQTRAMVSSRLLGLLLLTLLLMLPPARSRCCLVEVAGHDALLSS
jgi:hypothetical protein